MTAQGSLSVIALHGVADSSDEIERMSAHVERRLSAPGVRWLFPRAPQRPVTILGRRALAWYDILAYDRSRMDEAGIAARLGLEGRGGPRTFTERDRPPRNGLAAA